MSVPALDDRIALAARWLTEASGLLITAGAGMGVDSGLPDFRGDAGFWRAYPALGRRGMRFTEIACPAAFRADPALAWGFYGHRLALYRATQPHVGFALLHALGHALPDGVAVFTSNVDGQFQKAGFAEATIVECHGSIHHLQCLDTCRAHIWPAHFDPEVDAAACRYTGVLPACPHCAGLARPNVLMFDDGAWQSARTAAQQAALHAWWGRVRRPVVIELGAGTAIPTVRMVGERLGAHRGAPLIRINPDEAELPRGLRGVGLPMPALDALVRVSALVKAA